MPELPEVETVRRGLAPVLEGARIDRVMLGRPDLRFPLPDRFAERLEGRRVSGLSRRAKYLIAHLDDGVSLIAHLGMTGSFRIDHAAIAASAFAHPRGKDSAHDHVRIGVTRRDDMPAIVTYNDPRRFGFMDLVATAALADSHHLAGLGIEPTGNALDGATLQALLAGRKAPLKAALLDQGLIAGLGNIYVCEALSRAGLSPLRRAGTLARRGAKAKAEAGRLADAIRAVIAEAIDAGGSSLRDYVHTDGSLGYFQHRFRVYDRAGAACPTPGCGGTIERIVQSGRSSFFCRRCQH